MALNIEPPNHKHGQYLHLWAAESEKQLRDLKYPSTQSGEVPSSYSLVDRLMIDQVLIF